MSTKKITAEPYYDMESIQSKFTKDTIKEKLKDYKIYPQNKWNEIETGDLIRYVSNGAFRSGGYVKRNAYPDYIVIANYINHVSWCLQLKEANNTLKIYIKSKKKIESEKKKMKKIYELYKDGKLEAVK